MQTSSLVTLIRREAPDWSRVEIVDLINEVQRIMLHKPLESQRYIDPDTGKDPVLATTAETFEYELNAANGFDESISFVEKVYSYDTDELAYNYDDDIITNRCDVISYPAIRGAAARVVFKSDPGTGSYYVVCYKAPSSILLESDVLEVPEHWHIRGVKAGVVGLIESAEHGNSNNWTKFEKEILPAFSHEMNRSAGTIGHFVTSRGY